MENTEQAAPVAEQTQGVQAASFLDEKTDPMEVGLQQPVKMEGVADKTEKVYGEKVDPSKPIEQAAPVAAPIQQIAPVSANGEQTSARESPKNTDVPATVVQVTQPSGEDHNPSADEASPSIQQPEVDITTPEETKTPEIPFEDLPPLEQANNLLGQIPGRFRLY